MPVPRSGCGITISAGRQGQEHDPGRRAPLVQAPGAVDGERGQGDDDQELAELRGLELHEGQRNPAPRALDRGHPVDDQVEPDHHREQAPLVLAQPRVVDPAEHAAPRAARCRRRCPGARRRTADGRARLAGGAVQGDQRAGDQPDGGQEQQRIGQDPRAAGHHLLAGLDDGGAHSVVEFPDLYGAGLAEEPLREDLRGPPARRPRRRSRPARRGPRPRSACWWRWAARSRRTRSSRAGRCTGRCRSCRRPARGSCPSRRRRCRPAGRRRRAGPARIVSR